MRPIYAPSDLNQPNAPAPNGPTVVYHRVPLAPRIEHDVIAGPQAKGTCILLHGWGGNGADMLPLAAALQLLPAAAGWNFVRPTYETHLHTFVESAAALYPSLQSLTPPLLLVGYSEGGIVARQLVASGLPIRALVTICSPHLGILPWIPTPDLGSASVSPFSQDLFNLNANAADIGNRARYYFFAITSTDLLGPHPDDGVVCVSSALGQTLGVVAQRTVIGLNYNGWIAGWDPHLEGMNPDHLQPVLTTCGQLFQ